jgi:phosphatidate cytidylyltransferase
MFFKRLISSSCIIIAVAAIILIDWYTKARVPLCGIAVTFLIVLGLYEFFSMLEHKGINIYKYFGIGMGAIIPLSIIFRFETTKGWELFFILSALLFLILMQFRRRDNSGVIVGISTTLFGILYVSWFLSFLIKIRYLANGIGLLATVLLITKLGDIGAYLVGSRLGKTPLLPRISPKKSVEGAIGGLVFSILGALVSALFLKFSYWYMFFLGLIFGVLSQLGDLSESLIKRDCQLKDSGNIFPGMGGVLDTIDSLLFTAPVFYFYISTLK